MRIFKYLFSFIVVIILGVSTAQPPYGMKIAHVDDDKSEKNEVLLGLILEGLKSSHFQNKPIDDRFSEGIFNIYIERLDYYKRFLLQTDYEDFKKYIHLIDNEINDGSYEFFDYSIDVINKRIKVVEDFYPQLLKKPFDFTIDESIELDNEKYDYAANNKELRESWRKYLKYQTLVTLNDLIKQQEKLQDKLDKNKENSGQIVEKKSFSELEIKAREKVLKNQDNFFRRLSKLDKEDRLNMYINSIVNTFDPHTSYFPPKDKENFDIQLSGRLEGIGAQLQEKDGYIKVSRIVIGSACWRQGELKADDIILKVAQGSEEPVDIVDMRIDDAVKLIRGKKGTEVRLTVKKLNGDIVVIPIIRDVVLIEETYAKSVLLNIKEQEKNIGYIKLPKFYTDFNKNGGRNCTEDVKNEIKKLKQHKIDGLILDLRNNEGGALIDAVKIAGLFIDKGPVVQVKSRNGMPYVYEDKDPKVQYDGPLVILVNFYSASASEILAAAIQDYKRGIIIGSSSTYGKGTVQSFYNLDRFLSPSYKRLKPLGYIKLTVQKFYRINGGATQLQGVIPDIIVPDSYSYLDIGEKELDNVIPWDEIQPLQYHENNAIIDFEHIKNNSDLRIENNTTFQLINENAERLKNEKKNTLVSLNMEKYNIQQKKKEEEIEKYKDIKKPIPGLKVISLQSDVDASSADSVKVERIKIWHESLKKDVYLNEAIDVLLDL